MLLEGNMTAWASAKEIKYKVIEYKAKTPGTSTGAWVILILIQNNNMLQMTKFSDPPS